MSDDPGRSPPPAQRRESPKARPEYKVYRSRPRLLERRSGRPEFSGPGTLRGHAGRRRVGPPPARRALRYLAAALGVWLVLSLVLFLISAQIEESKTPSSAERALDIGGIMPFAPNTILVLGSDARARGTHEGGANVVGQPSRSDTIMLLRAGGLTSARLSIPRDTVVDIPGHGPDKVNAAYAIGGPALAITTIKRYLGIDVNHLIEVNFANFPRFIDALGGINVQTRCVKARLDGGDSNGGTTINLHSGTHHLDGRHALGLARVRKNSCAPAEGDIERAARQQAILSAIKRRLISPATLLRLPWVSWAAPKAIRTDMSGPTLLALFVAIETSGSPPTRVLHASGFATTPGGGAGLTVSDEDRRVAVRRFLGG
ncbi:MAG: LCP family protein [Solirubrobacteraceae bacterium]